MLPWGAWHGVPRGGQELGKTRGQIHPTGRFPPFPDCGISVPIGVFAQHLPCLLPGTTQAPSPGPCSFWGLPGRPHVLGGTVVALGWHLGIPGRLHPSPACALAHRLSQLLLESKTEIKAVNPRRSADWPLSRTSPLISSLIRLSAEARGFSKAGITHLHVLLAATRLGLCCRGQGSEATPGPDVGAL